MLELNFDLIMGYQTKLLSNTYRLEDQDKIIIWSLYNKYNGNFPNEP